MKRTVCFILVFLAVVLASCGFNKSVPLCLYQEDGDIVFEYAYYGYSKGKIERLSEIEKYRKVLSGKKVVMTTINSDIDWLLDTAEQAGVEFKWIGVLNYLRQELRLTSDPARKSVIHEMQSRGKILEAIDEYDPDIVITNYSLSVHCNFYQ